MRFSTVFSTKHVGSLPRRTAEAVARGEVSGPQEGAWNNVLAQPKDVIVKCCGCIQVTSTKVLHTPGHSTVWTTHTPHVTVTRTKGYTRSTTVVTRTKTAKTTHTTTSCPNATRTVSTTWTVTRTSTAVPKPSKSTAGWTGGVGDPSQRTQATSRAYGPSGSISTGRSVTLDGQFTSLGSGSSSRGPFASTTAPSPSLGPIVGSPTLMSPSLGPVIGSPTLRTGPSSSVSNYATDAASSNGGSASGTALSSSGQAPVGGASLTPTTSGFLSASFMLSSVYGTVSSSGGDPGNGQVGGASRTSNTLGSLTLSPGTGSSPLGPSLSLGTQSLLPTGLTGGSSGMSFGSTTLGASTNSNGAIPLSTTLSGISIGVGSSSTPTAVLGGSATSSGSLSTQSAPSGSQVGGGAQSTSSSIASVPLTGQTTVSSPTETCSGLLCVSVSVGNSISVPLLSTVAPNTAPTSGITSIPSPTTSLPSTETLSCSLNGNGVQVCAIVTVGPILGSVSLSASIPSISLSLPVDPQTLGTVTTPAISIVAPTSDITQPPVTTPVLSSTEIISCSPRQQWSSDMRSRDRWTHICISVRFRRCPKYIAFPSKRPSYQRPDHRHRHFAARR